VVNLNGVPLQDRPTLFVSLLARLGELRCHTGHPHWIVVDEAHHVLPSSWEPTALALPSHLDRMLFITLDECDLVAPVALKSVDTVIAVGAEPEKTFERFGRATGESLPQPPQPHLDLGEVVYWSRDLGRPIVVKSEPGQAQRKRHSRKYAEGDLGPDRSFYFRGPHGKLHLRANNLIIFLQMADGVDDETWLHHLERGHYSQWFREAIKDPRLADEAAAIETSLAHSASESLAAIKALVEQHYTLPGGPATPVTAKG
jgi:hypothetical protein